MTQGTLTLPAKPARLDPGRIARLVVGGLGLAAGLAFLAAAVALSVAAATHRDGSGYFPTHAHHYQPSSYALSTQILDVGRNDYYGHSGQAFDVQDSGWLSHLPQQRLTIGMQGTGASRGSVRMTSPTAFQCAQACNLQLDRGLAVTLVARPAAGARFAGWKGACTGRSACVVTLDAARSVIATFGAPSFRLTVGVGGKGRVSSSPLGLACPSRCSASFRASSTVRLRATASPGFVFVRWSGSCQGNTLCVVKLDGNRSVRAIFRKRP